MPVTIDNLQVTVRVKTAPRAILDRIDDRSDRTHAGQRVYLMPPPEIHAAVTEAQAPLRLEEEPDLGAWAVEDVNPNKLADRVYEFMRADLRVAKERNG